MTKKSSLAERICGNCRYHNTYDYPNKVFCVAKFSNREKPVVSIFHSCDKWEKSLQECFCVEAALKKGKKKK